MMLLTVGVWLLASLSVAFPKDGAKLPYIERCYMIGATDSGATNLLVNGECVAVHPLGGWVTMINTVVGVNKISIGDTNLVFTVAAKPQGNAAPTRTYEPLPDFVNPPATNLIGAVLIDAGHGGDDVGTVGPHGLKEKDANLLVAKSVARKLEQQGFVVYMTRENDIAVPLYDRPKLALTNRVDAFISIHHNAPPFHKDPRELRYHAVYAWNNIGDQLARAINVRMAQTYGDSLVNNGVIRANFAVIRNNELPSCLVEVDFMTTPEGEIDCFNRRRIDRVASAIAEGFEDWYHNRQER